MQVTINGKPRQHEVQPRLNGSLDVIEQSDSLLLKADLPGFRPENVAIEIEENILTLRAQSEVPAEGRYLLRERTQADISRTLRLPFAVDTQTAKASFKDGVLTLVLPKPRAAQPFRIPIQ